MSINGLGIGWILPPKNQYIEAAFSKIISFLVIAIDTVIIPLGYADNFPKDIQTKEFIIQQDLEILANTKSFSERLCFAVNTLPHAIKIRRYIKCQNT